MAIPSEQLTTICNHCDRAIPTPNIDLHTAHCARNLEKCKICGDMVPRRHVEEHYQNTHAPVACSLCSKTMEREILAVHKGENCPQRIVTCEFCEFPLPAVDLSEHQVPTSVTIELGIISNVGGLRNRTEYCHLCSRYIRLRERNDHEMRVHGSSDSTAGPSRDASAPERREHGAERRRRHGVSQKHLLFTIAITGIAVLLGSIFFQRKTEARDLQ
ncbi:hypothetical protein IFM89_036653 [Coptis chinensis]|uniref:TRAF-type domain-containing protein n=1 Tax=Coptis chinensis TaxID=261450 RepID=A0A835I3C7_9MAGN|nr:hypothetical protein IFM89_036653 [Coptis chinensis]